MKQQTALCACFFSLSVFLLCFSLSDAAFSPIRLSDQSIEQEYQRRGSFFDWHQMERLTKADREKIKQQILFDVGVGVGGRPHLPTPISNVNCTLEKFCDEHGVCSMVCKRGSVQLDPWMVNAISTQINFAMTMPFCYAQLPGTHNSAISFADGYGNEDQVFERLIKLISWIDKEAKVQTNDQWFSLTDQLRMGVRMVELDTHWVDGELRIAHCGGVHVALFDTLLEELNRLSHLLGLNVTWDTETLGCQPSLSSIPANQQRSLLSAFQEISDWLFAAENADAFLVIFFDCQIDLLEWKKLSILLDLIDQVFGSTVFTPADYQKYSLNISMETMVKMGKRVLFTSGANYSSAGSSHLFYKYGPELCHWSEPDLEGYAIYPNCSYSNGKGKARVYTNSGQIIRMETSELMYGPFNSGFHWGPNTGVLTEQTLPEVVNCNTNYLCPDCLTPTRVEAMVWSWAPGHPLSLSSASHSASLCASVRGGDGRWISQSCATTGISYACQSITDANKWVLSAQKACPAGFLFGVPNTPYQNQALLAAMKASSVSAAWIDFPL